MELHAPRHPELGHVVQQKSSGKKNGNNKAKEKTPWTGYLMTKFTSQVGQSVIIQVKKESSIHRTSPLPAKLGSPKEEAKTRDFLQRVVLMTRRKRSSLEAHSAMMITCTLPDSKYNMKLYL